MNPASLTQALKESARTLGFDLVGACPAVEPATWGQFLASLDAGFAGQMDYLQRHAEARRHPSGQEKGTSLIFCRFARTVPQWRSISVMSPFLPRATRAFRACGHSDRKSKSNDALAAMVLTEVPPSMTPMFRTVFGWDGTGSWAS